MNVGELLDVAAANLAQALVLTRHVRAVGADEQIALAVARTRVYQELDRQLNLIAGPDQSRWDSHTFEFRQLLRGLTKHTDRAVPHGLPQVPARGPAGIALHQAATALAEANNVLESHLGDRTTPRSPEGVALAARHRQADNLAATGRLAVAALELDERLRADRWLSPSPLASETRGFLVVVDRDVRSQDSLDSRNAAREIARAGDEPRGYMRELAPLPSSYAPALWATVNSARQALAATDAARIFLFRHGSQITAEELTAIARVSGRISVDLADVLAHCGTSVRALASIRQDSESQWKEAARSAGRLRIAPGFGAPAALPVASTALRAVAAWLDSRLRTEPGLRGWLSTVGTERRTVALRRVVGEIAVRLSDVVEHLRSAVDAAQTENRVYHPARSAPELGRVIQTGKWLVASTANPQFSALLGSLDRAQRPLSKLANISGVPMLPGPREVANAAALRRLHAQVAATSSTTTARPAAIPAPPNHPDRPRATTAVSGVPPGRTLSSPRHRQGGR